MRHRRSGRVYEIQVILNTMSSDNVDQALGE